MGKLFGTDGIRGVANDDLTCELAYKTAISAVSVLAKHCVEKPKIIIGKDTRISGDMLTYAMAAGFCAMGADVTVLGVVPTPCIAFLVRELKADVGVMISASHNPSKYNGIKFFNNSGFKLSDEIEDEIELLIEDESFTVPSTSTPGCVIHDDEAVHLYEQFLIDASSCRLDDMKIVLDLANGSASKTAYNVFSGLGAQLTVINNQPNGFNINHKCGSTHIDEVKNAVLQSGADIGFSFDGDADRCLAVDKNGSVLDGDKIICFLADHLKNCGELSNNSVCVTVMSNMGLKKTMTERDIKVEVTAVGDRYVLEKMVEKNISIGGEQSGHIILLNKNTTGDGQMTAVMLASALKEHKKSSSDVADFMPVFPQLLLSVKSNKQQKQQLLDDNEFINEIKIVENLLKDNGRVLIRASGTEPIVRIMVEAIDIDLVNKYAYHLQQVANNILNK